MKDILTQALLRSGPLPPLLLQAEQVAHTFMRGEHGRRRVGMGEAFWQFRPYTAGDTVRQIDWKQTAKREKAFVRQTEWEAAQTLWLYRDTSESMKFTSQPNTLPSKNDYAEILLLALGILALDAGEQVALLGTDLKPQAHPEAIRRVHDYLPQQKTFLQNGRDVKPYSHIVLISDFYDDLKTLSNFCEKMAKQHINGVLVQIYDPVECDLSLYSGRTRFLDMEQPKTPSITIPSVDAIRGTYMERFKSHQDDIKDIANKWGWGVFHHDTAAAYETVLADIYTCLEAR